MIAWLALLLGLLNLLIWALVGFGGLYLYRQAKPMLSMLGLGASVSPAPPPTEPAGPPGPAGPPS